MATRGEGIWRYLAALAALMVSTLVVAGVRHGLDVPGAIMVMLLPVLWSAVHHGRTASLVVAVLAAAISNFLFFHPVFEFGFQTIQDAIRLGMFLVVALTTGTLASRLTDEAARHREQAEIARQRSADLAALHSLGQAINAATDLGEMIAGVEAELRQLLGMEVTIQLTHLPWAPSGRGVVPLRAQHSIVGAMILDVDTLPWPLPPPRDHLVAVVAGFVAAALERAQLRAGMEDARVQAETERVRSALLSSVSHDFRTPLGSIMGAASSLLSEGAHFSPEAQRQMVATILQSAQRLDRYVRNILDLTVIEAGQAVPNRDWVEVEDVIGSAIGAVEGALGGRPVSVHIAPGLPLLSVDFVQIERVLVNMLENAAKFSLPDSRIEISAFPSGDGVEVAVFNSGSDLDTGTCLFERFQRGHGSEVTGTGLGLAICRGFMRAHGGDITAERDPQQGGVRFRLLFPPPPRPPAIKETDE